MIELKEYKGMKDNQEFLKNRFVVINSDGDEYILKTVGKSIYIIMRIGYKCYFVCITRKGGIYRFGSQNY